MNHSLARTVINSSSPRNEEITETAVQASTESESVQDLAKRTKKGDELAFAEIYRRMYPRLRSFMTSRLHSQGIDAEEVIQEAFLKAWRNIEKFDEKFQFSTWIYTIAIRTAKDIQRSKTRQMQLANRLAAEDPAREQPSAEQQVETIESSQNVWSVARSVLTPDQYSVMWLRYGEELSIQEIAKVLTKTSVGVRVLLHRARGALQDQLKGRD
ncbi:MAG: RNA polymerase sigma factor [Planctomycetota bacterium]